MDHLSTHEKVLRIALIGLLSALCVIFRIIHLPIPNVQPDTDLIMMITLMLGNVTGISVAAITIVLSNVILGFGIWTLPQIGAYIICVLLVSGSAQIIPLRRHVGWQVILATFLGFVYGFFVSLGMMLVGGFGITAFWAYYLNGLVFDCYHAGGNLILYPLLYRPVVNVLKKYRFIEKKEEE
ncbi:ECF transporter S component [Ligilactobacillus sp. LYQ60]|uniref:ECF transporter S component n=1 Tax=unclassified Ligilactobacillus TaxID=2767920 RepID=UPI003851ED7A